MSDATGYAMKRSMKRREASVMRSTMKSRDIEMKT
jgi:hypothetical protein